MLIDLIFALCLLAFTALCARSAIADIAQHLRRPPIGN